MSGDGVAEAAGSSGGLPSSSLPWHQIPKFEPGITDVRTYARKLEFLRDLWPAEHIEHLAPRAALLVEGVAFQKVARLQASKLKTREGVQYLVESLGGQWGRGSCPVNLKVQKKTHFRGKAPNNAPSQV